MTGRCMDRKASTGVRRSRPGPDQGVPSIHRVPAHLARRFNQICLGMLSEVTEVEDLSPVEYAIVASLDDRPGIDQHTLALRIGIDTVSAHHLVGALEARGLIDRRLDPGDRRARILALTARGSKLRRKLRQPIAQAHDRIMSALSDAERQMLVDMLARVIEANDRYAKPGNGRRLPKRGTTRKAVRLEQGGVT
jgi:MarR family transcriptional regulator, temperature-dependent positive regulator of motility